jgi:transcriptional regulator with XRE-family HTH domain
MTSTYEVKVWQDGDWWLARVVGVSDRADPAPLNSLTQARTLAKIEPMARDLIATILDTEEDAFKIDFDYVLPDDLSELLCQARGARAWMDAAQNLWQERSAVAARALADKGYSLRETATLLGLSHQRIDQLLGGSVGRERSNFWAFQLKSNAPAGSYRLQARTMPIDEIDVLVVVHDATERGESRNPRRVEIDAQVRERARDLAGAWMELLSRPEPSAHETEESGGKVGALCDQGGRKACVSGHLQGSQRFLYSGNKADKGLALAKD